MRTENSKGPDQRREERQVQPEEKCCIRDATKFNHASGRVHQTVTSAMSYLRLSLTYQIAAHYGLQLLRSTMPVMLIFSMMFATLNLMGIGRTLGRVKEAVSAGITVDQQVLQDASASVEWGEEGVVIDPETGKVDFWGTALSPELLRRPFRLTLAFQSEPGGQVVSVTFLLEGRVFMLGYMLLTLLACDLFRLLYFIRHRNRIYRRVLAPIRDMTDMAATLSANNLSNRLNVAGVKNELKDLAAVINSMLDRIELSYNSQKQFVSDASHELRTPLAVIQGYTDMLRRWGKDDPNVLEEGIEAISQEAASMKELVESLLFLARHDKKTLLMEMETFQPREVIQELHKEALMVAPEHTFVLDGLDEGEIEADRSMVKQVMRILLDNAVKYTPKGGTITMGVRRGDHQFTFTMQDTGPGIAPHEAVKVFDRFYRAEGARKSQASGHGLGLSIARIIVMAHDGKIQVRSKQGEGTAFLVTLPEKHQVKSSQEERPPLQVPETRQQKKTGKRRKSKKVA